MSVVEMKVPTIGESINEVTLSKWLKGNGEYISLDEPICEFESDKATLEFPAEAAGKLTWVANEGDDLKIGALVAKIDTSVKKENGSNTPPPPAAPAQTIKVEASDNASHIKGHPSPAANKIMKEQGLTSNDILGSGKDGRITKEDALKATENKAPAAPKAPAAEKTVQAAPAIAAPLAAFSRNVRSEKMSRMRRTIAQRLVSAKNNTAMLTTFNEVDLTGVMKLRETYQDKFVQKYGIKLGFMSIFAKACAKVLMEMPEINAQINENDLIYHDFVDISIAISTPTGLVVPPVHNVESLKFHEIEFKIKELSEKARNGSLTLEEMKGGTFTITNGGVFGSMMSTPIINEPQSAILGMHAIIQRPVAIDGKVEIRPMMYLALSYDHRVIDGSSSVTFLVKVKKLLEDPIGLLLDL